MSTITTKDGTEVSDKAFGEGISELSSRSENGIDVASSGSNATTQRSSSSSITSAARHSCSTSMRTTLDMFHHPYAYAAHRRIDHGLPAHGQDFRIAA